MSGTKPTISQFSVTGTKPVAVDFNLFQPYIHHEVHTESSGHVPLPYVSDYTIAVPFNPYPYTISVSGLAD